MRLKCATIKAFKPFTELTIHGIPNTVHQNQL